ncbi:MAG: hypothetical protein RL154_1124 [Pseudomonadota bacterium]|jgi:hypothetical protein
MCALEFFVTVDIAIISQKERIPKMSVFVNEYLLDEFKSVKNSATTLCVSSLQKDLFYLLEYDESVESYDSLPFSLRIDEDVTIVPDCLIKYKNGSEAIVKILSLREFRTDSNYYEKQFDKISKVANAHGFMYKVFTEKEIYTNSLNTLKYLYDFAKDFNEQKITKVCQAVTKENVTLQEFIDNLCDQDSMSYVYESVRRGYLSVNIGLDANLDTTIAINKKRAA